MARSAQNAGRKVAPPVPGRRDPGRQEAAPMGPLEFQGLAGHLIRRMHQLSVALFEAEMTTAGFDLTPVQFAALVTIAGNPGRDQASIAQAIAYDPVTIGGVLQRLEAKGYLRRDVAERDRRARRLVIEPAGQAILSGAKPVVLAMQDRLVAGLDEDERATLLRLLAKALAAAPDRPREGRT